MPAGSPARIGTGHQGTGRPKGDCLMFDPSLVIDSLLDGTISRENAISLLSSKKYNAYLRLLCDVFCHLRILAQRKEDHQVILDLAHAFHNLPLMFTGKFEEYTEKRIWQFIDKFEKEHPEINDPLVCGKNCTYREQFERYLNLA